MKKHSLYTLFLVLVVVIITIPSFFFYLSLSSQAEMLITKETKTKTHLAETISEILYSPFWGYRMGMFPGLEKALIEEIVKFENVVYLRIVSTDGAIHQSTIEGEWGKKIEDPELLALLPLETISTREEIFQEEEIKSIIYPSYGNRVILLGFSLGRVEKAIREMILYNFMIASGNSFMVILLTFFVLKKGIINPIKKMVVACEEVRKGNLNTKIDVKSKTEIGELAATFNEMVEDLKKSRLDLEEAKNVLEIKVAARTKELKSLTEGLEEQVKERTKEVYGKIEELERFQKLVVGRELRMLELKKEVEKMKEKLGKNNPNNLAE